MMPRRPDSVLSQRLQSIWVHPKGDKEALFLSVEISRFTIQYESFN